MSRSASSDNDLSDSSYLFVWVGHEHGHSLPDFQIGSLIIWSVVFLLLSLSTFLLPTFLFSSCLIILGSLLISFLLSTSLFFGSRAFLFRLLFPVTLCSQPPFSSHPISFRSPSTSHCSYPLPPPSIIFFFPLCKSFYLLSSGRLNRNQSVSDHQPMSFLISPDAPFRFKI